MNYFLNQYQVKTTIFFWFIILVPFVGLANIFILGWITKLLKLSHKMQIFLFIFSVLFILISLFYIMPKLEDKLNHGMIKELFIMDSDEKPLITLWLMRIHNMRGRSLHDQRLETFELNSGKRIGMVEIQHRTESSNYKFYWPVGSNDIWGINGNKDIQLFSFAQPGSFKSTDTVPKFTVSAREGWDKRGVHEKGWSFRRVAKSLGKNLIGPDGKLNSSSVVLLNPVFIEELNRKSGEKNKIWIFHRSAVYNNIEPLVSYVDANGQELSRINLNKIFNKKKARPCAVYTRDNEVMVFITCGDNKKAMISENLGFTLSALRVDRSTGKALGRIDYIK